MKKRGQFYLIAAIVIIAIIIGFATISNYYKEKSSVKIYDLKEELGIESGEVLDYGIMNEDINYEELIEHFTTLYDTFAGENSEIYFIFGNNEKIFAYNYGDITSGTIDVDIGGKPAGLEIKRRIKKDLKPTIGNNKVKVTINNDEREFELKPGENFYFVISQEIGEEQHIITG